MEWTGSDFRYEYTYQHWIFLRLPSPMQQGMAYTVTAGSATNASPTSGSVTFDIYNTRSEAVHVNLVGYMAATDHKAADLYAWLGNGGARDYSSFEGNTVYVYNVGTGQATPVGSVTFWKPSGPDVFFNNLTRSAVWNVDFPGVTSPGTYRLAVEGVGSSQDFTIANNVYANPFRVSLRGFYYMRLGQDNPTGISPPPRTPLYIPGSSPANTVVVSHDRHAVRAGLEHHPDRPVGTGPTNGRPIASPATRRTPTRTGATPTRRTGTATSATSRSSTTCSCPTSSRTAR